MSQKQNKNVFKVSTASRKKTIPFIIALANKILNAIGFVDYIDQTVEWDSKQCKVSPGNLAKAVILATFFDIRAPLYKISETYQDIDTEFLFGKGVRPEDLNEYAIGRTLDKLAKADPEKMFSNLSLKAYSVYRIAFQRLHSDTTSLSFYGNYDAEVTEETEVASDAWDLQIVTGYNKDQRIGCKQAVIGKIVNEHGLPVASSTMNGNTSDVEWNTKALQLVADIFAQQLEQFVYIADSKLMNIPLFRILMHPKKKVQFITRCPANFNNTLEARVIDKAYAENNWVDLGTISDRKNASVYKGQEFEVSVDGRDIRCIVYQTSEGQERLERKRAKALEVLEQDMAKVGKKIFVCEADAVKEFQRFQKAHKSSIYSYRETIEATPIEKRPRGNPGKNPKPPKIETKWSLRIEITGEDYQRMQALLHKEECFVLITNTDPKDYGIRETLEYYKNQSVVEIQFRLLKQPCIASVIYLDTPERIRALVMLFGISLLVRALIQYKLRKGFKACKEPLPKVGWHKRKLQPNLTIFFFQSALGNHAFVRENDSEYSYSFSTQYKELQITTLLALLDLRVESLLE